MAIDSKQKRGSAIGVGLPFRQWLSEPSGALDVDDRLSLLKWFAGTAEEEEIVGTPGCAHMSFSAPNLAVMEIDPIAGAVMAISKVASAHMEITAPYDARMTISDCDCEG